MNKSNKSDSFKVLFGQEGEPVPVHFVIKDHAYRPGTTVVEIWDGDQFVGQITPLVTGCGLRIASQHDMACEVVKNDKPQIIDVMIAVK